MSTRKPIRVLVVDDNDLTRALLSVILRSGEYEVVAEATTAKEGLEMARKLHPDVVLLDHNMPNGYGVDIVEPLRQSLPQSVILMVTTQNEKRVVELAIERGANGFVVKPFNTATVLETMKKSTSEFTYAPAARVAF